MNELSGFSSIYQSGKQKYQKKPVRNKLIVMIGRFVRCASGKRLPAPM
jgi:hypothetical protein